MRVLALALVVVVSLPLLATAAVDPAEREAALKYERTVQAGNQGLRAANKQAETTLASLLLGTPPSEKEIGEVADALQKAVTDFQSLLKEVPPPAGKEAQAYALTVNAYLGVLEKYKKEDLLKALKAAKKPGEDIEKSLGALEPLMKLGQGTKTAIEGVRRTRQAFLAAYEITPADLGRGSAGAATNTPMGASTAGAPSAPAPSATTTAGSPPSGPAALDQTIRAGQDAFNSSIKEVQFRLLPKLLLGGEIEPAEIEETFAGITAGIAKFEAQLAAAKVPSDPESKAYHAAAQNLLNSTKSFDFTALAKILSDKSLAADAKQTQLVEKLKGMEAVIRKEFTAFREAQRAFQTKHNITPPGAAVAGGPAAPAAADVAGVPQPVPAATTPPGSPGPTPATAGLPPIPPPGSADIPAAPPAAPAVPLTGPAALDHAIREGEKAFRSSTEAVQTKLVAKLTTGAQIDPAELEETIAGIKEGLATFEAALATAEVPDDPESKAYVAAAKRLVSSLKKADFAGVGRILGDKTLGAEAKQALLGKKMSGLEAGLKKDATAFDKARKAFTDKHKLSTSDSPTSPMAGSP